MAADAALAAAQVLPFLLLFHAVLGGADTLVNHELIARLPRHVSARRELALHALREAIFATLFVGLAWLEWHGAAALVIAILLAVEVINTAVDELEENRTRVLPHNERAMHVFLTLNLGLIVAAAVPTLLAWGAQPTALVRASHGWPGVMLTVLGAASLGWSIRDARAARRLSRVAR